MTHHVYIEDLALYWEARCSCGSMTRKPTELEATIWIGRHMWSLNVSDLHAEVDA
jgi:hypothetical protein